MSGIVFILTNPFMPDLVLLDTAPDEASLRQRVAQLSTHEAVPVSFSIHYARSVADAESTLEKIFTGVSDTRIISKKNFFRIAPEKITSILQIADGKDVVVDDASADDLEEQKAKGKAKIEAFRFSMVGIKPGTELHFSRDPSITAVVEDDRGIRFEGEVMSMSKAARKVFMRLYGVNYPLRGPHFWMHAGETLTELRLRLEDAEEEEMRQVG